MQAPADAIEDVLNGLQDLIVVALQEGRAEKYHPSGNVDIMENNAAASERRVKLLRSLREQFENEMRGEF